MAGEAMGDELRPNGLRRIRSIAIVAYCGALTWIFMEQGVPTGRLALMGLTIIGLAITSLGYGWRRLLRILVDWLPFTLVLLVYDQSRVVATTVNLPLHETDIASAERWMFGGNIPAVWMQHHFYTPSAVHWWDAAATLVYVTHFLATPILAAVLWLRNRKMWVAYITRRWRYLAALYPVAMGVVLVYTGEHYVLDLVVGAAYALIVHALVSRWERRRAGALRKDQESEPITVA